MGDDLKTTLGKVAQSRGRKTYFFGYVVGKRKDNKGEGSLDVVPGQKTFKKEDFASDLTGAAGTLYQGKCWGDSEGAVIFLGNKSLTDAIVGKIKTMVNKLTSKTFEFQLPDEAEEKRLATLEEVELAAERNRKSGQGSTPGPEVSVPVPGEQGKPPPVAPEMPKTSPTTAPEKPKIDPASKSYEALLAGMQDPLKELEATNAAEAAKIRQIIGAAAKFAKPGEYPKAVGYLKEAGKALAAATSTKSAARAGEAGNADQSRLVKQRQFMLTRWALVPAELKVASEQYKTLIVEKKADANPEELSAQLDKYLLDLVEEIKEKLDTAINAGDASVFAGLRASVATDELIVHLATSPGIDGSKFSAAILTAMTEIEAAMAA